VSTTRTQRGPGPGPNRGMEPPAAPASPARIAGLASVMTTSPYAQSEFALGNIGIMLSDRPSAGPGSAGAAHRWEVTAPSVGETQSGRPPYWTSLGPGTAEQEQLGDAAGVEAHASAVGAAAVLTDLVPDVVALALEAPGRHHLERGLGHRVRHPQVEVGSWCGEVGDGEGADLLEAHRLVAGQSGVLGGRLAGAVVVAPGRIGVDRDVPASGQGCGHDTASRSR